MTPERFSSDISPLTAQASAALLGDILRQCSAKLVCFDLDSTLIDNRPRNAVIMREFGRSIGHDLLQQASADHFPDWSAANTMVLLGLSSSEIDNLLEPYLTFWEARFFTSEYCVHDVAIAGAVTFATAVFDTGGVVRYLTGRDETMRSGTADSLSSLGFPVPGLHNVQLSMNPARAGSDDEYKRRTLADIATHSTVIAAFDNEPTHINAYRQTFPDAHCVHLHTDHSMRDVKLLDGIVSIMDFNY